MSSIRFKHPDHPKADIVATTSHQASALFGCHSTGIANIAVTVTLTGDVPRTPYGEPTAETVSKVRKYLEENSELREKLWTPFSQGFTTFSLVFMSAPVNTQDNKPDKILATIGPLSTSGFAAWLKERGEFIMGSPLITNPNHQWVQFSLLRGWMWIPYRHDIRHIEGTEYVSGKMRNGLPFKDWFDFYEERYKRQPLYQMRPHTTAEPDPYNGRLVPFEPGELMAS